MADYIERAALLHKFNIDDMMNVNGTLISLNDARQTIENAPAADVVEVRHGRWVGLAGYVTTAYGSLDVYTCSNCNAEVTIDEHDSYCPCCGAKMEDKP